MRHSEGGGPQHHLLVHHLPEDMDPQLVLQDQPVLT